MRKCSFGEEIVYGVEVMTALPSLATAGAGQ